MARRKRKVQPREKHPAGSEQAIRIVRLFIAQERRPPIVLVVAAPMSSTVFIDPYPKPSLSELELLKALCDCRCSERAIPGPIGECVRCGRVISWSRWLQAA